jgi:hypothetical protein
VQAAVAVAELTLTLLQVLVAQEAEVTVVKAT